jgi:hypothetical protein
LIHALRNKPVLRRREVRPAHSGGAVLFQSAHHVVKPIRIRIRIAVDEGHDFAPSSVDPKISGSAQAAIGNSDAAQGVSFGDQVRAVF